MTEKEIKGLFEKATTEREMRWIELTVEISKRNRLDMIAKSLIEIEKTLSSMKLY